MAEFFSCVVADLHRNGKVSSGTHQPFMQAREVLLHYTERKSNNAALSVSG